jgi:serine/threonine-protein kinase
MLAGRPAFGDEGQAFDVMLRILRAPADPLSDVAPWVPEALARVVEAGLERERVHRIPDAATFAARLAEAMPDAFTARGLARTRFSTIPAPSPFDGADVEPDADAPPSSEAQPRTWLEGSEPRVRKRR